MRTTLLNKINQRLGDFVNWWVEDDTLYAEGLTGLKSEVYENDLILNFDLAINILLSEIESNYLRPIPLMEVLV